MMKKYFMLLFFIFGFLFLFDVNANASVSTHQEVVEIVEKANAKIDDEIEKAIEKAEKLDDQDKKYDEKLDKIIVLLLDKTYDISSKTIENLEKDGIEAECYHQLVIIGDRMVYVDPIRVHSW